MCSHLLHFFFYNCWYTCPSLLFIFNLWMGPLWESPAAMWWGKSHQSLPLSEILAPLNMQNSECNISQICQIKLTLKVDEWSGKTVKPIKECLKMWYLLCCYVWCLRSLFCCTEITKDGTLKPSNLWECCVSSDRWRPSRDFLNSRSEMLCLWYLGCVSILVLFEYFWQDLSLWTSYELKR